MDSSPWTSNSPSAQPMPMGFEWSRDQNLQPSESIPRPVNLQGAFQTAPHHHNGNGSGANGGALIHSQPSPSSVPQSHPASMGLSDQSLGGGGLHSTDAAAFSASQLHQHQQQQHQHHQQQQQQQQQQRHQADIPSRAGNSSSPREEFHHHQHMHPGQQQLHQGHSPYSQNHIHGHEFSQEQQQLQQQQQQQQQSFQHPVYSTVHYYPEAPQHEAYEHSRAHSGGLVGQPYGHSQDNLSSLTPPPSAPVPNHDLPPLRARLTNTIWEDERTFCYQVDVKGVCVARRADNDMVNGTKLLNVVGMSRGKRDGILKNEKGRIVVKVGAMHLKGVWIPLDRAVHHAKAHNIEEILHPLLVEDPTLFLYQHPHGPVMNSDPRWASQSQQQQQQQHDAYHAPEDSPSLRHSDSHSNHHFSQNIHGDYYSHPHHGSFRGHGVSPHGSPNGSNGSVSGDDDPNLVSPFDYRVQSSIGAGGLIGIPIGGSSGVADLRSGAHHPAYYGHQSSPHQYYNTHASQKYQESLLHPGPHQIQLGGPLANDSPPLTTSSTHERIQDYPEGPPFSGQKRLFNFSGTPHGHRMCGLSSSGMSTGNISPPLSITPSEGYSPMEQYDFPGPFSPGQSAKRPRPVTRGSSNDPSNHVLSGRVYSRDDGFGRPSDPTNLLSYQSASANAYGNSIPIGIGAQQQYHSYQHQHQHQQYYQEQQQDTEAGRPRFIPDEQDHPSAFRDIVQAVAQSGTPVSIGRT